MQYRKVDAGDERLIRRRERIEVVDVPFDLSRVSEEQLIVGRLLLETPQLGAARVRLAECDEAEHVADRQQGTHDAEADQQLRAELKRDASDGTNQEILGGRR